MFGRQRIATLVAEFLGTGVLTLLILSVQRSTIGVPFFVAMAAGLTLALMMFALARTSGGHFNPAITLALWTARKLAAVPAVLYIVAQLLGGYAAYSLYTYFVNSPLQDVGGEFSGRILVAEAVGAGIFAFGWAAAMYQGFTRATTAAVSGLSYMIGIVAASSAAIGLLNPAVAFGVKAWVLGTYVLGPVLGAIIGMNLYGLLFARPGAGVAAEAVAANAPAGIAVKKSRMSAKKTPAKKTAARKTSARR